MPQRASRPADNSAATARAVMEVVPMLMRLLRSEMRAHGDGLSVPQFRTLLFVGRNPGCPLAAVAGHLGITPATASATVERLVRQGQLARTPAASERRRVELSLTGSGRALVHRACQATQTRLTRRLSSLGDGEQRTIDAAMELLRSLLDDEQTPGQREIPNGSRGRARVDSGPAPDRER